MPRAAAVKHVSVLIALFVASLTEASTVPVFGTPVNVCGLNTAAHEFGSSISTDCLTMFLDSIGPDGNTHLFGATRPDHDSCFSAPSLLPNVNAFGFTDQDPEISSDGLTLYFTSNRANFPQLELFEAVRPDTASVFGLPRYMAELNLLPYHTFGASISGDGLTMVFSSDRPSGGGGSADIWITSRPNSVAFFGAPVGVTAVNSLFNDTEPEISFDGLVLYFTSDRPGGSGDLDLWAATRLTTSSPFGTPLNLTAVNSSSYDAKANISASGDELYLQSGRPGGVGMSDIWVARPAVVTVQIDIKPGSFPNSINLGAAGVIPVAILSSGDFDAPAMVAPETLSLAGASVRVAGKSAKLLCHDEDVNQDGRMDVVCQFTPIGE